MRNQTPLAPREPFDVTVHMVLKRLWAIGPRLYRDRRGETDEAAIVENILSGAYSHPVRMVAFNTVEGWSRDVTEDVARALLKKAQSEHRLMSIVAQEFLGSLPIGLRKATLRTRRLGRGYATAALLPMRRHTGDDYRRLRDLAFFSLIQTGA